MTINPAIAYDTLTAFAIALDKVLNSNGGATHCTLDPSSEQFGLQLRKALYQTNFDGLSGTVTVTQCAGADFSDPALVNDPTIQCGERFGLSIKILGFGSIDGVIAWRVLGYIEEDPIRVVLDAGQKLQFLGNNYTVPADQNPTVECPAGQYHLDNFRCAPSPAGTFTETIEQSSPHNCYPDSYQDEVGQTSCKACPDNTLSQAGTAHVSGCICLPGYYKLNLEDFNSSLPCLGCPTLKLVKTATCPGGMQPPFARKVCAPYLATRV